DAQDEFQWFLIPSTAGRGVMSVGAPILKSCERPEITSSVFEQQYPSRGFAYSDHLFDSYHRVGERTGGERRNHGVETIVVEFECLRIHLFKRSLDFEPPKPVSRLRQHLRADVDTDESDCVR